MTIGLDVEISTVHFMDHIEWDLSPPLPYASSPNGQGSTFRQAPHVTPELFAKTLAADLSQSGEAIPIIAHAIHEEILKHKKDAIEWGVLFSGSGGGSSGIGGGDRGRGGQRGAKMLRGIWRDWNEVGEFSPRLEVISQEEMERREVERERIARWVLLLGFLFFPY